MKITIESQSTTHHRYAGTAASTGAYRRTVQQETADLCPGDEHSGYLRIHEAVSGQLIPAEGRNTDIFPDRQHPSFWTEQHDKKIHRRVLKRASDRPRPVLEVNTMDILIEFAKIGLGIGCDPGVRSGRAGQEDAGHDSHEMADQKRTIGFAYNPGDFRALEDFLSFCDSFPIS